MKKKKIITSLIFLLSLSLSTIAQKNKTPIGIKGGINYSKYDGNIHPVFNAEYTRKTGYFIGVFTEIKLFDKLNLKPEIIYNVRGSNILFKDRSYSDSGPSGDETWRIEEHTFTFPFALSYNLNKRFNLEAGPQFSLITKIKETIISSPNELFNDNEFPESSYDNFDFSLFFGIQFKINERLALTSRFIKGLTERDSREIKTSNLNLGIEFRL